MSKIIKSLKNINWKLFISLLVMGLVPAIYTTVRVFFIGQLPGDWSFSIAGQLSWVNLIYEILNEAIILPLYFFMGKVVSDKAEYTNRIKTGLIISFLYLCGLFDVYMLIYKSVISCNGHKQGYYCRISRLYKNRKHCKYLFSSRKLSAYMSGNSRKIKICIHTYWSKTHFMHNF